MNIRRSILATVFVLGASVVVFAGESVPTQSDQQPRQSGTRLPKSRGGSRESTQVPELNQKIIAFCEANADKQVGSGQCAALAEHALREAGAKPRHEFAAPLPDLGEDDYVWGQLLQPTDPVLPGDILQFRDVELKFRFPNGSSYTQTFSHHTAVVYRVHAPGVFTIVQQNVGGPGRTAEQKKLVQAGMIDVRAMTRGTIWAYRPVAK